MSNPNNLIYVNVPSNFNVEAAIMRARTGTGTAFDWEMYQLSRNPAWQARCVFYQGGRIVASPF